MKKVLLLLILCFVMAYCKSKKSSTATTKSTESASTKPSALAIAQNRWNGTTQSDLEEGKTIFSGKCTKCHGEKKIVTRSEKGWLQAIDDMAPKAGLTSEEKLNLTKYILSYREANTTTD